MIELRLRWDLTWLLYFSGCNIQHSNWINCMSLSSKREIREKWVIDNSEISINKDRKLHHSSFVTREKCLTSGFRLTFLLWCLGYQDPPHNNPVERITLFLRLWCSDIPSFAFTSKTS